MIWVPDLGFLRIRLNCGIYGGLTLGEKMTDITIRQLLEAGVHFGHQVSSWNPKMAQYIFGSKNKIHIIDLEKTLPMYKYAINFLSSIAAKKGNILFVGTKQQARSLIRDEAKRCRMPYIDYRWLGGMLTNYKTIRQSLKRLTELEALRDSQTFVRLPKKEALSIVRNITKLEKSLGGIREMGGLPDAILVIDVGHEKIAISEATKLRIPIIGIVDTNNDPSNIDYIIPGNDDSIKAIKLYLTNIVDSIINARTSTIAEEEFVEKDNNKEKNEKYSIHKKVIRKKKHEEEINAIHHENELLNENEKAKTIKAKTVNKIAITKVKKMSTIVDKK
ncbi:MAG: 30S ribosomal protein S2 [Coxiellaceae bacterium]|jgi:small subunit ribosomal protein S2|nr:30S ribosomal protein S2 [Coxiellaceae bacterium]